MKQLVISGINLFEGGPLSIYYDCLNCIRDMGLFHEYEITAFVHKKELFENYQDIITLIELPKSRVNYIYRLYYEYIFFYRWSHNKNIDIWLSLHDITPRVCAKQQYTYCHNPSPFMKKDLSKIRYDKKNVLFSYFYKYIYRINISHANGIIVQQDWIRKQFLRLFPITNVIVARPTSNFNHTFKDESSTNKFIFIYAAFPRYFKNFELICQASTFLNDLDYEIWLHLHGNENVYSKNLHEKFQDDSHIKWLGLQSRDQVFSLYEKV